MRIRQFTHSDLVRCSLNIFNPLEILDFLDKLVKTIEAIDAYYQVALKQASRAIDRNTAQHCVTFFIDERSDVSHNTNVVVTHNLESSSKLLAYFSTPL